MKIVSPSAEIDEIAKMISSHVKIKKYHLHCCTMKISFIYEILYISSIVGHNLFEKISYLPGII